jgi:hypothetical protein
MQQCYNYVYILSSLTLCSLKKKLHTVYFKNIVQLFTPLPNYYVLCPPFFESLYSDNRKSQSWPRYSNFIFFNSGMTNFLLYCGTDCCNYSFLPSGGCILCILCAISRKSSPRICRNWYLHFRGKPAELHFHCILFMILKDQCLWHKLLFA